MHTWSSDWKRVIIIIIIINMVVRRTTWAYLPHGQGLLGPNYLIDDCELSSSTLEDLRSWPCGALTSPNYPLLTPLLTLFINLRAI
jgi:hypothetical protein